MRDEISAAVLFLARLIEKGENFNQGQLEDFKARLSQLLLERFENHWFPELPHKGQGYRCIRVNERDRRDASLEEAARACGIKYEDMKLPPELTIWVDPNEVCCRFGEIKGSYCTLASFNDNKENVATKEEKVKKEEKSAECKDSIVASIIVKEENTVSQNACPVTVANKTKEFKVQMAPLTPSNSRHGGRKNAGSPRQKNGNRRGGSTPGQGNYHHPLQSWYNIISPPWMPASPPPPPPPPVYHPMLRTQGTKWGGTPMPPHHRYHWSNKSTLKV